jgi:hypothetical protein
MKRCVSLLAVVGLPALLLVVLLTSMGCDKGQSGSGPVQAQTDDPELTGPDLFEDVTASSGIAFSYRNGEEVTPPHLAILESLGGGLAVIDYDGDGLYDLYLVGGGHFGGPDNKQILGLPGRLYRNLGGWKFQDVTAEAGLDKLAGGSPWFYSHGAAVADYDRDGWPDLLVSGWRRIALLRNVPTDPMDPKKGRRFEDVSAPAGLDNGVTWATSAAWADLDGDGFADLYACQYVDWSFANHPDCNYDGKTPDVCPPKKFSGLRHKVYRNTGTGRFEDESDSAGLSPGGEQIGKGLGVVAVDVNFDGRPEVYVANDTVANFLYVNRSEKGKIRLSEEAKSAAVALDGNGSPNGSMGVDAGDPFGIGRPSIWVTNYENELHALYRNECKDSRVFFLFVTPATGIAAIGQKFVGWGTGFVDVDRDGDEDLVAVNGHAIRYPTGATRRQKPVLLRNQDGRFKDVTPRGGNYFRQEHLARGMVLADLDNDGKVDMVSSHMNEPYALIRNTAPGENHWVGIQLSRKDFADVVGSRVVLESGGRKQTRFAKGGGSYASSPDRRLVFGLGTSDKVDKVTVYWPDGTQQEWTSLRPDRYHVLAQGEKEAREPGPR